MTIVGVPAMATGKSRLKLLILLEFSPSGPVANKPDKRLKWWLL